MNNVIRKMKDSEVDWIGDIPEEWEVRSLKSVTSVRNEKAEMNRDDIYIGLENIQSFTSKYVETETIYEPGINSVFKKGDILFNKLRPYLTKALIPEFGGFCTSELIVFSKYKGEKKFLLYLLLSPSFIDVVNASTYGSKMPRANWSFIRDLRVPLPPLQEQQIIVNYLDEKIRLIDNLISEQKKAIEQWKAYKQSLITEIVTKGLNPDVEMKDSGIEWIGKIPMDWGICKVKHLLKSKITDGPHETPIWVNDGVPFLSAEAIVNSKISISNMRGYITKEQYEVYAKKSRVYKNDILFCKSGSTTGKSALVKTDDIFGIWSPLAIIRANENKLYHSNLFYFIQSSCFTTQVSNYWTFGTQPNIGMRALENLYVAYSPRLEEQRAICDFLDEKCTKIDESIEQKEALVRQLEAYKQSLIYECVTGKRQVI